VLLISLLAGMTRLFTSREWVLSFSSLILGLALKLSIERFPF